MQDTRPLAQGTLGSYVGSSSGQVLHQRDRFLMPPSYRSLSNAELILPASDYGQKSVGSTYFLLSMCYIVCNLIYCYQRQYHKNRCCELHLTGTHVAVLVRCKAGNSCKRPANFISSDTRGLDISMLLWMGLHWWQLLVFKYVDSRNSINIIETLTVLA